MGVLVYSRAYRLESMMHRCSFGGSGVSALASNLSDGESQMLSNFTQFTPQGLAPQIPGLQGIGAPQLNSVLSGQPGVLGHPWPGYELGQHGAGQQPHPWPGPTASFGPNPNSLSLVPVLGQLTQQLAIQSVITQQLAQQISIAVQHLAQQLSVQGLPAQYYGQNPYGQNPYAAAMQGGYSGFNPQVQAWGANRPPTIQ
jgi:hypothetical protein